MTREELKALDDSISWEEKNNYGKNPFEEIAEGLLLLNKFPGNRGVCAEHDIIYAHGPDVLAKMSEEDCRTMLLLGWHWNKNVDCWASHT